MMPVNWGAILKKYSSADIPHHVRMDMAQVVEYAKRLHQENQRLVLELAGAKQTMLALSKIGTIELPHASIEQLHPKDQLLVEDVDYGYGLVKRFTFVAHDAPEPEPTVN